MIKSNSSAGKNNDIGLNAGTEQQFSTNQNFIKRISKFDEESKIMIVEQKSDQIIPVKVYREAVIPFNINRHVLLVIVILYVIFVGTHFLNWTRWANILTNNHAFSELCPESNTEQSCDKQDVAINDLLLLTTLTMFTFTFLAGLLLDLIGPKVCSLFGITVLIVAWSLLISKQPVGGVYKGAFALLGAGSDPAFFGTLSISNLFPGYSSTVISVFGAARSVSNVWPVLLELIASRFPSYTLDKMAISFCSVYVICVLVVLIFIPMRAYVLTASSPPISPSAARQSSASVETDASKAAALTHYRKMTKMLLLSENSICLEPYSALPIFTEVVYADQVVSPHSESFETNSNKGENPQVPLRTLQSNSVLFPSCSQKHSPCCALQPSSSISYMDDPLMPADFNKAPQSPSKKTKLEGVKASFSIFYKQLLIFGKHFKDPKYLPIVILCAFNIIRNNYFLTSAKEQLGPAEAYLAVLNILAFIPGPICGILVDRFGPLAVITGINFTNTLMFFVLFCAEFAVNITLKRILQYTAVTLAFPGIGYLLSQIYCYIAVHFPTEDLGKLAGFASFISGVCGLVVSQMNAHNKETHTFWHMNLLGILISFAGFACIGFVYYFGKLDVTNANTKKQVDTNTGISAKDVFPKNKNENV